jgi:hypothetical protein
MKAQMKFREFVHVRRPDHPYIEFRGQVICGEMDSPDPSGQEPEGRRSK